MTAISLASLSAFTSEAGIGMFVNRRKSERVNCNRVAKIQFGTGALPRDCQITDIYDGGVKVIADYQAAIKARDPKAEPEFVSLEGYIAGRLAIAALEKAGADVTRAGLLKAIKGSGQFDIGGLAMTFSPTDNEGLDRVFLTVIQPDGSFKAVDKLTRMSGR